LSSAQSSFTAIIGAVFCVLLLAIALNYVNLSASLVNERFTQQDTQRLAILLSNDLILNPGYPGYLGLALYNPTTHSVEEHVIDLKKVQTLSKSLDSDPTLLNTQWSLDTPISLLIKNLDTNKQLINFNPETKGTTISRLALMEGQHVKIELTLA